jgi:hypothetical protein
MVEVKGKIVIASELFAHISDVYIKNTPRPILKQALDVCKRLIDVLDEKEREEKIKQEINSSKSIEVKLAPKKDDILLVDKSDKTRKNKRKIRSDKSAKKRGRK